jgi:hypothetical protein
MPTQRNMTIHGKLRWKEHIKKNVMSSTSNSGKCIGCLDAILGCQSAITHRDLGMETVTDIIAKFANSHEKRFQNRINIEASRLFNVNDITRHLKRKKPFELVRR